LKINLTHNYSDHYVATLVGRIGLNSADKNRRSEGKKYFGGRGVDGWSLDGCKERV
jgi:hypothetical protein